MQEEEVTENDVLPRQSRWVKERESGRKVDLYGVRAWLFLGLVQGKFHNRLVDMLCEGYGGKSRGRNECLLASCCCFCLA